MGGKPQPKQFHILLCLLTISVPDEGYSKNIIVRKLRYQRFCYLSPIGEIL